MSKDIFKFSIITVCYNAGKYLENTLLSVINQTFPDMELIIIDGGSTDDSLEIIKRYRHDITFWVSERDNGIYDAMNKGIRLASGDWLLFMNAGDTFADNDVLTKVAEIAHMDSDVIFGDNWMVYDTNKIYHKARFFSKRDINMPFNHQSALVKTSIAKEFPFDICYKIAGDYAFFYNLFKRGKKFQYVPIPIANYAMDGMSQQHVIRTFNEVCEIQNRSRDFTYWFDYLKLLAKIRLRSMLSDKLVLIYRKRKSR